MYEFKREFRSSLVEEVVTTHQKEDLKWRNVAHDTAKAKYKFVIYSKREGNHARYALSTKPLQYPWEELKGPPSRSTFEEAKTKTAKYVRICIDSIPEKHGMLKIPIEIKDNSQKIEVEKSKPKIVKQSLLERVK